MSPLFSFFFFQDLPDKCPEDDNLLEEINGLNLNKYIEDTLICRIEQLMRQKITPEFWSRFSDRKTEIGGFEQFKDAVDYLYTTLTHFLPILGKLEKLRHISRFHRVIYGEDTLLGTFKVIMTSTLLSQLPLTHQIITEDFYKVSFKVFCNTDKSDTGKIKICATRIKATSAYGNIFIFTCSLYFHREASVHGHEVLRKKKYLSLLCIFQCEHDFM